MLREAELEAEKRESSTKSSFVYLKEEGSPTPSFGRVQHFFQHSFGSQHHHFAIVTFMGGLGKMQGTGCGMLHPHLLLGEVLWNSTRSQSHLLQHPMMKICGFLTSLNVYVIQ